MRNVLIGVILGAALTLILALGIDAYVSLEKDKAIKDIENHCKQGIPLLINGVVYDCFVCDLENPVLKPPALITPPRKKK